MSGAEFVLCVRTEVFDEIVSNKGAVFSDSFCESDGSSTSPVSGVMQTLDSLFRDVLRRSIPVLQDDLSIGFLSRDVCEHDPSYKQIIPYTILSYDDHSSQEWELLSYWRSTASSEERLHGNCSIGIGGHVNVEDVNLGNPYEGLAEVLSRCRYREIYEEVAMNWQSLLFPENESRFIGIINDDSNDVGKVHLGLVYEHFLVSKDIYPKENALKTFEFMTVAKQKENYEFMESWSQIVYRYLEKEEEERKEFLGI